MMTLCPFLCSKDIISKHSAKSFLYIYIYFSYLKEQVLVIKFFLSIKKVASEVLKRLREHLRTFNFWQRSEVFGNSSKIFGSRRDVYGNLGHDKVKISRI